MELRRSLSSVIGLALVSLLVVACGTPRIIEHPQPALTVDAEIFRASDRPVIQRECGEGVYPDDMYGGLDPSYPTAICCKELESGDQCLRERHGMWPTCYRVIVYLGDSFQVITTQGELRDLFAPIESADEALSYALLATDYWAWYDPEDYRGWCGEGPEDLLYHTDFLEDTHVVETVSGYEVNLFHTTTRVGCGSYPIYSVPVRVSHDGTITVTASRWIKLFEINVEKAGGVCCVD